MKKPEKKIVATMNTEPARMPTHASTVLTLPDLRSAAGAATGANESVGFSGDSGVWEISSLMTSMMLAGTTAVAKLTI